MKPVWVTPAGCAEAAQRLAHEGIWVRRDLWVDEDGLEVAADDPRAVTQEFLYEVDYDRIVALVVEHLATHPAAPAEHARAEKFAQDSPADPGPTR